MGSGDAGSEGDFWASETTADAAITIANGVLSAGAEAAVFGVAQSFDGPDADPFGPLTTFGTSAGANGTYRFTGSGDLKPVALYNADVERLNPVQFGGLTANAWNSGLTIQGGQSTVTIGGVSQVVDGIVKTVLIPLDIGAIPLGIGTDFNVGASSPINLGLGTNTGTAYDAPGPNRQTVGLEAFINVTVFDAAGGDLNGDGETGGPDANRLSELGGDATQGGVAPKAIAYYLADFDDDMDIDKDDMITLVETYGGGLMADISFDGDVDIGDFTIWADNSGNPGVYTEGDFSADAVVDIADFTIWADNYGRTGGMLPNVPAMLSVAAVPEPASVALLGTGLIALLSMCYRRLRAHR